MAKASLIRLDQKDKEVGEVFFMFNPKELTFSKTNNWNQDDVPKANVPAVEFKSGGPTTLKLQLYFDTYKDAKDGKCEDVVQKYTSKVCAMMDVDPSWKDKKNKKGRPPTVRFNWGSVRFDAVISSISQRFTLFTSDGTPVRAVLDVSFSEVKDKNEKAK